MPLNEQLPKVWNFESWIQNFLDEIKESILNFLKFSKDNKNDLHLMIQLHPWTWINDWYVCQFQSLIIKNILTQRKIKSSKLKQIIAKKVNEKFADGKMELFDGIIGNDMKNLYNMMMSSAKEKLNLKEIENYINNLFDGGFGGDIIREYCGSFGIDDSQKDIKELIVKLIWIEDEYIVSICDAFKFWNGCTDDQKNMCKDITDEQVYLKYPWINEVLSSKKINSEQRNQVKDAFRLMLHMSESNLEIVKILESLKGNGYSIPLFLRNLTDDWFSIDEIYEKGSLKELNCLFKSDNGIVWIEIELEHIANWNVNGFVVKNLSFKDESGDAIRIDTIDPDKIRMFHELYMHLKKGNEK